jgi:hypothetical protein
VARAPQGYRALTRQPHKDRAQMIKRGGGEGETSPEHVTFLVAKRVTAAKEALSEFLHGSGRERGVRRSSAR